MNEQTFRTKLDSCLVHDYVNVPYLNYTSTDPFRKRFTESVNQD